MSTLNYTLIDADQSAGRDDSSIESVPGTDPGNAIQIFQYNAAASSEVELVRSAAGSESFGSTEGLLFIGEPTNMGWVSLTNGNTGSASEEKLNIDGAIRGRGFLDAQGRNLVDLLENLLPAAPDLQTFASNSGNTGKIGSNTASFGFSQNDVFSVQTQTNSDAERGILDDDTTFLGDLNFDVVANNIHSADVFGPGEQGYLYLSINGDTPGSPGSFDPTTSNLAADLDYTDFDITNRDTTNSQSDPGFILQDADNVTFANGETFNDGWERAGQYYVDLTASPFNANDVNSIRILHFLDDGTLFAQTNRQLFFIDADENAIAFTVTGTGPGFDGSPALSTARKLLSGVEFAEGAESALNVSVDNVYRNSYANGGSAIFYNNKANLEISDAAIPDNSDVGDVVLIDSASPGSGENPVPQDSYTVRAGNSPNYNDGPDLLVLDDFEVRVNVQDPLESTASTATLSAGYNLLVDNNFTQSNADLREDFIVEEASNGGTRLVAENVNFADATTLGSSETYDSTQAIVDNSNQTATAEYEDELQVYGQRLIYPQTDFTSITNLSPGTGQPDYATDNTVIGEREYTGYATDPENTSDFAIRITESGATNGDFTEKANLSTAGEVALEVRIGGDNDSGWLDAAVDESQGGAFAAANGDFSSPGNVVFNGDAIGITLPNFSGSNNAGDKLFYRLTYATGSTGVALDSVKVDWAV